MAIHPATGLLNTSQGLLQLFSPLDLLHGIVPQSQCHSRSLKAWVCEAVDYQLETPCALYVRAIFLWFAFVYVFLTEASLRNGSLEGDVGPGRWLVPN